MRTILLFIFTFLLLFWDVRSGSCQKQYVIFVDGKSVAIEEVSDSLQVKAAIQKRLNQFRNEDFLFAGIDSIRDRSIYLHRGDQYTSVEKLAYLYVPERDSIIQIERFKSSGGLLKQHQKTGFPFASVDLDSINFLNDTYQLFYSITQGPFIKNDSIALLNKVAVKESYLAQALEMSKGDPFRESSYLSVNKNIERIPFLSLTAPADISFEDGKSIVYLSLKESRKSSFEGVVGLLPRQNPDQGLAVTGYLDLELGNLFQSGIEFETVWNKFANKSQSLTMNYYHPYIFKTPLSLDLGLEILKQDTSFITRDFLVGIGSFVYQDIQFRINYINRTGSLIDGLNDDIVNGNADYQTNLYSIGLGNMKYKRPFRFAKGFRFNLSSSIGNKQIINNASIADEAYDTLQNQSVFVKLDGFIKYQITWRSKTAIFQQVSGSSLINSSILKNELVRVGGLKSVRGFNENFFYAQHHLLSRLEIRQYFEQQSYFMLFYDQLFYEFQGIWDYPFGFGAGININTSNGLFTFALAAGKARDIPLNFSEMKVHFGYITMF